MSFHDLISGFDLLGVGVLAGDLVFLALAIWAIVSNMDLGHHPYDPSGHRS